MLPSLFQLDRALFTLINQRLVHPLLDFFFWWITDPDNFIVPALAGVALLVWRGTFQQRMTIVLIVASLIFSDLLSQNLKLLVDRERPALQIEATRMPLTEVEARQAASRSPSFPSAHAANMFAMALIVAWQWRRRRWVAGISMALAVLIAYSRVYLGVHFPSDVIGGALLGLACSGFVIALNQRCPPLRWEAGRGLRISLMGVFILLGALLTVYRLSWAMRTEFSLTPTEAYVWDLARSAEFMALDAPAAMLPVDWARRLFGDSQFAVRAPAVLLGLAMSWALWGLVRRQGGTRRRAIWTVGLANVLPGIGLMSVLMTPTIVALAAAALTLNLLWRAVRRSGLRGWTAAGLCAGLGAYADQALLALVPCVLLAVAAVRPLRARLGEPGVYLFVVVAFTVALLPGRIAEESALMADERFTALSHYLDPRTIGSESIPLEAVGDVAWAGLELKLIALSVVLLAVGATGALRRGKIDRVSGFMLWIALPLAAGYGVLQTARQSGGDWAVGLPPPTPAVPAVALLVLTVVLVRAADLTLYGRGNRGGLWRRATTYATPALAGASLLALCYIPDWDEGPAKSFVVRHGHEAFEGRDLATQLRVERARADDPARTMIVTRSARRAAQIAFHLPAQPAIHWDGGLGAWSVGHPADDVPLRTVLWVGEMDGPARQRLDKLFPASRPPERLRTRNDRTPMGALEVVRADHEPR